MCESRLWKWVRLKREGLDGDVHLVISGWGTGKLNICMGDRREVSYSQDELIPDIPRNGFRDKGERVIKIYCKNGKEEKFEGRYLYETEDEIFFSTDTGERKFNYNNIKAVVSEKKQ